MDDKTGVYRILVRKHNGMCSFWKIRRKWEDNIKIVLQELGSSCMDWIDLVQDTDRWWALVNAVINLRVT